MKRPKHTFFNKVHRVDSCKECKKKIIFFEEVKDHFRRLKHEDEVSDFLEEGEEEVFSLIEKLSYDQLNIIATVFEVVVAGKVKLDFLQQMVSIITESDVNMEVKIIKQEERDMSPRRRTDD